MVWAKLDDAILDNRKIAKVGVLGFALHVAAITWCSRNLSDGFVPRGRLSCLIDMSSVADAQAVNIAKDLVKQGLWDEVEDGYQLHDYLEYNPSRETVLTQRNAKSEAGKKGAQKRWGKKPQPATEMAPAIAPAMAPAMADGWQSDAPGPDPEPLKHSECVSSSLLQDPDPDPDQKREERAETRSIETERESGTFEVQKQVSEERAVQTADKIPEEQRQAAGMLSVQDIEGAWLKFTGYYAGRVIHVPGMWQRWCVAEAKRERTELDRRSQVRYRPPDGPEPQPEGPAIRAARARRDREWEQAKRDAVPAPIGDLMAALNGGRRP